MSQELKKRVIELLECRWFDVGNWRFSCDPSSEDYYPNQWWSYSPLTIYTFPLAKNLGRGVLIDVDEEIINAIKMQNIVCHPSVQGIEAFKCSEVISVFPNIDENIILGVNNRKLYVPYLFLNHP